MAGNTSMILNSELVDEICKLVRILLRGNDEELKLEVLKGLKQRFEETAGSDERSILDKTSSSLSAKPKDLEEELSDWAKEIPKIAAQFNSMDKQIETQFVSINKQFEKRFDSIEQVLISMKDDARTLKAKVDALTTYREAGLSIMRFDDRPHGYFFGRGASESHSRKRRISIPQYVR